MPEMKRQKTKYPGVTFIIAQGVEGPEKVYYIRYRKNGKLIEEKAGRQYKDDMTPARANNIRTEKIQGRLKTNKERRTAERAAKAASKASWTFDRLFCRYLKEKALQGECSEEASIDEMLTGMKFKPSTQIDISRYKKFIKEPFGSKEPSKITIEEVDSLRFKLSKVYKPQSVKHVLNLITRISNYGHKKRLIEGLSFTVEKPVVDNLRTEDLSPEQLKKLLKAIKEESNRTVANMMLIALYTGMRRGELLKLKWNDINLNTGFITIRNPKGGKDAIIPLNPQAREILNSILTDNIDKIDNINLERKKSPFVFPGRKGNQRTQIYHVVTEIKKRAGLPDDFRPMHGLRHAYASMLASSGKVDLYTLQKLLTHKDAKMTARYAHLRDETLRKASGLIGDILDEAKE